MASSNSWAIFNGETNDFECRRCGDKTHVILPMEVKLFAKKAFAFADLHDDCIEPRIECDYEQLGTGM